MKLTAADREALSKMPEGWFQWIDLGGIINNPEYRVKKLYKFGYLEREESFSCWLKYKYRKSARVMEMAGK
jgi:hypothetical protein